MRRFFSVNELSFDKKGVCKTLYGVYQLKYEFGKGFFCLYKETGNRSKEVLKKTGFDGPFYSEHVGEVKTVAHEKHVSKLVSMYLIERTDMAKL